MAQENAEHQNGASKAVSFSALKPQLFVPSQKADEAVLFYKAAFGAEELKRMTHPKRKADQELPLLLCAELNIGSSLLLVCDQTEDSVTAAVKEGDGSGGIVFRLETDDVEGTVSMAVKAGAALQGEIIEDEGACGGGILGKGEDPFGVFWVIASPSKNCANVEA